MRIEMRQGVVSHQSGGFLHVNASGNVDILATNRPTVVTTAHHDTNYLHSEDAPVVDAWSGPFSESNYWLYWDFDLLTFQRTFGKTTLEPIAQSIPPNGNAVNIIQSVVGSDNNGIFVVGGYYVIASQRPIAVTTSATNDGVYTVVSSSYNSVLGQTSLYVAEPVISSATDGVVSLDLDGVGIPLLTEGRMWYDTNDNKHYEYTGGVWIEVLRVFAARLINGAAFLSHSILGTNSFTGTQIGDTSSVLVGRVLFTENSNVIQRDNRTFLTTEDQFFTNQSRVDAIRLESNVTRAKSTESAIASFTVVAWVGEGSVGTAQYDHTSTTILGMLTEDIFLNEVGAVVVQGVITNPAWNWTATVTVGTQLWVENGLLTPINPHVSDVLSYPYSRVPVARVLDAHTIIFEQGLGGVGDRGPTGAVDDLPPANTIELGAVTLITPSSDTQRALVVSDTDPRLVNARTPSPHTHPAVDVLFTPGGGITSNTAQSALEELGITKFNISGGALSGALYLTSNPTTNLQAATKQYVDGLVSGLVWLDPVQLINLISDNITSPPASPHASDAYVVPPGAIGDWSAIPSGHVVLWDGTVWVDQGSITTIDPDGARFGIAVDTPTTSSGSFFGKELSIVEYDNTGNIDTFHTPTTNNAIFVNHASSLHAFDQFAFSGTEWILFGGAQPVTADGTTTSISANQLHVKQFDDGGINDVKFWQGLEPADLSASYSVITHTHQASDIPNTIYNTSPAWGTLANASNATIATVNIQSALEELVDKKAGKQQTYVTVTDAPLASTVEGMVIYVRDQNDVLVATTNGWEILSKITDAIPIPYDVAFSISGQLRLDTNVGAFVATRPITISNTGAVAHALTAASSVPYAFRLMMVDGVGTVTVVGSISFTVGDGVGLVNIATPIDLVADDVLYIATDEFNIPDPSLDGVGVTLIGCAIATPCDAT